MYCSVNKLLFLLLLSLYKYFWLFYVHLNGTGHGGVLRLLQHCCGHSKLIVTVLLWTRQIVTALLWARKINCYSIAVDTGSSYSIVVDTGN